jgi:hypothetical protein
MNTRRNPFWLLVLLLGLSIPLLGDGPPAADVSVTGTLSSKSIRLDEMVEFTITVNNKTRQDLKNFRLLAPPDSYQFAKVYARGDHGVVPYEDSRSFQTANSVLIVSVPAGTSYSAWGYLTPTIGHTAAALTMAAEWTNQTGKSATQASTIVSLGENEVQTGGDVFWGNVVGFTKALALPVTLALLPFILSPVLKRRDNRTETLRLLLSQFLEYSGKYYLPLSAGAERLADAMEKGDKDLAFYYIVYLEKRMDEQRKAVGGFYFKDVRGERLASQAWKEYSEDLLGKTSTDALNRAVQGCMNKLEARENYDAFAKIMHMRSDGTFANPDAHTARQLLETKLNDKDLVQRLVLNLQTVVSLIDFEVNRPFENWYPTKSPYIVAREVKDRMQELGRKVLFTEEENKYFEDIEVTKAKKGVTDAESRQASNAPPAP